jgi:hypothetical protein
MEEGALTVDHYESLPLKDRYQIVREYFGYSIVFPDTMRESDIRADIKQLFAEYEQFLVKDISGRPDPLSVVKGMSNIEHDHFLESKIFDRILICLHHALVKTRPVRTSLKDSLAELPADKRVVVIYKPKKMFHEMILDTFWEEIKTKHRKNEVVPF